MHLNSQHLIAGLLASGLVATAACAPADRPSTDEQAAAAEMARTDRDVRPDATISTEIRSRYYSDDSLRGQRIDVRVNDGVVALGGTVGDDAARQRAVTLASDVAGVREVDSKIELASDGARPDEGRTARGTDAVRGAEGPSVPGATDVNAGWITTKIQAAFFVERDVKARNIDVTTSDTGIVMLEGHVETEQASVRAADIARGIDGVRRVDNQLRVVPGGTADTGVTTARRDDAAAGDGWVTMKIQSKYFLDGDVAGRHIDVDTLNGVVTLTGEVRTEGERRQAIALARNTDGVQSVNDQLRLVPETGAVAASAPSRSPVDVIDDAWLTTKIQAKYFMEDEVKGRSIDVTSRDGIVTLTGAVGSDTARRTAEAIASDTDGVARVVNRLRVEPAEADDGRN